MVFNEEKDELFVENRGYFILGVCKEMQEVE